MKHLANIISMQKYYIIFRSYHGESRFLRWFLKSGFGHVSVIKKTANFLNVIEPLTTGIEIDVVRPISISQIFVNISDDMTVLQIFLPKQKKLIISHFANYIPSCVTCSKAVLGVRGWNLTPFGLYKKLLKLGGTHLAN